MLVLFCTLFAFAQGTLETLLLYNLDGWAENNQYSPTFSVSFVHGLPFTSNRELIASHGYPSEFNVCENEHCAHIREAVTGDYISFGFTGDVPVTLNSLVFWAGNFDCQLALCSATTFAVEYATSPNFDNPIHLGEFRTTPALFPHKGYHSYTINQTVETGTYYFRVIATQGYTLRLLQFIGWDNVRIIGEQTAESSSQALSSEPMHTELMESEQSESTSSGISCQAQWECNSVSESYNYVRCMGACVCKEGFAGHATETDKCRCESPNAVRYHQGIAYCLRQGRRECKGAEHFHCDSVTTNYNFVRCNEDACECKTELGFIPTTPPSATDKCRCEGRVVWENGVPYCTS